MTPTALPGRRRTGETMSKLERIDLGACERVGLGARRPEDVVVDRDGTVWLSDQGSACARLRPDGGLDRVGAAGGAPNGINMDREGRIVIANFGGPEPSAHGPLQRLTPATGEVEELCGAIDGRRLFGSNYPVLDRSGRIWCTHSTWGPLDRAFDGQDDGLVYRVDPDGGVSVVATGLRFANGCALDADERYLYVCQTTGCNVVRFAIGADGSLGDAEPYGPRLGLDNHEVRDRRPLSPALRSELGLTDGCGFDAEGNLWVTLVLANRVVAIRPDGEVVTVLSDPEGRVMRNPTNVSWGGPSLSELYIGSVTSDYVLKLTSPIPGQPLLHQH